MRRWGDAALSGGLLVLGQVEVWRGGAAGGSWAGALTAMVASVLLLLRRSAPIRCAVAILATQAVCAVWAEPDARTFWVVTMLAWYAVGRRATPRNAVTALVAVCVVAIAIVTPGTSRLDWINLYLSLTLTAFVVPWLVGVLVRTRVDLRERRAEADLGPEAGSAAREAAAAAPNRVELDRLSPRELEVYDLLASGATNAEIAERLVLSVYTVKAHVASILTKLELRDRVQVVLHAHHPDALGSPSGPSGA